MALSSSFFFCQLERRKREPYGVGVCRSRSIIVVTIELVNFVVGADKSILILEHVQKTAVVKVVVRNIIFLTMGKFGNRII